MSLYLIPDDVNFDHVARVGPARLSTVKLLAFLLWLINIWDALELGEPRASHHTLAFWF